MTIPPPGRATDKVQPWPGWLVLAHVVLIPFFAEVPGLPFRFTTTDLLGMAIIGAWVLKRRVSAFHALRNVPVLWPSLALVATHWLALLVAEDLASGLKEVVKLSGIVAFYLVAASWLQLTGNRWRLSWALLAGATAVSLWAIAESIGQPLGWGFGQHRAAGTMGHANTLGGYLAAVIPVAWGLLWAEMGGHRRRWVLLLLTGSLLATGIALVLTLSRAAWLSLAASLVVTLGWFVRAKAGRVSGRRLLATLAMGFVLVSVVVVAVAMWTSDTGSLADSLVVQRVLATTTLSSFGDRERVALLEAAWGMFQDHPLLGVGPGNYQLHARDYTSFRPAWNQEFPHNVILHVASEAGIIGLLAFLWWTLAVLGLAYHRVKQSLESVQWRTSGLIVGAFAGVVSVLVGSLFGYPFVHGTWEPFVYCLVLALVPMSAPAEG